jgi:hypothetical protein
LLNPDHETAVDFLNYEAVAKTVVALLKENREHALTIGIHGDWGAGKSSVLKMTQATLAGDEGVACLWFNGWRFQGFDDAKTVLIETIITELLRQRSSFGKVKEYATDLLKRIDYLKLARLARPTRMGSSCNCQWVTPASWASVERGSLGAKRSELPLPARCSKRRTSSSSTRPPRRLTTNRSGAFGSGPVSCSLDVPR